MRSEAREGLSKEASFRPFTLGNNFTLTSFMALPCRCPIVGALGRGLGGSRILLVLCPQLVIEVVGGLLNSMEWTFHDM